MSSQGRYRGEVIERLLKMDFSGRRMVVVHHCYSAKAISAPAASDAVVDASSDGPDAAHTADVSGASLQTAPGSTNGQARPETWEMRPVREAGFVELRISEGTGFYGCISRL